MVGPILEFLPVLIVPLPSLSDQSHTAAWHSHAPGFAGGLPVSSDACSKKKQMYLQDYKTKDTVTNKANFSFSLYILNS